MQESPKRNPRRAPTLADVAHAAGVSKSAAGFALQGLAKVSPATRDKVEQAARALHYTPNLAAGLLSRSRHQSRLTSQPAICLLHDSAFETSKQSPELMAVKKEAHELGLILHMEDLTNVTQLAPVYQRLRRRGVRGLLVHQNTGMEKRLSSLPDDFSAVSMDHAPGCPLRSRARVAPDFQALVLHAWAQAKAHGYRRPGFALFRHAETSADDYSLHGAAAACLAELPLAQRIPPLETGHGDAASCIQWFNQHKPDVVIGLHQGVYLWLRETVLAVKNPVGFLTLFLDGPLEHTRNLAGFYSDHAGIARQAMRMLSERMMRVDSGSDLPAIWCLLPSQWQPGESLPVKQTSQRREK